MRAPEVIHRFIRRHRLHNSVPVNLSIIHDLYSVAYLDFSPACLGICYSEPGLVGIAINRNVHPYVQREVLCHEVAHHLLGHPGSLHVCKGGTWWYRHLEVEARKAAAAMLLPAAPLAVALVSGWTLREVADDFEVPVDLVKTAIATAGMVV